jgi:hypothetical protein
VNRVPSRRRPEHRPQPIWWVKEGTSDGVGQAKLVPGLAEVGATSAVRELLAGSLNLRVAVEIGTEKVILCTSAA